jgi:hypothetical protein
VELVYIEWIDSAAMQGWRAIDGIKEDATVAVIQSVGWVVTETEQAITLVAHMHKDIPQNGTVRYGSDPMTIPKGVIKERRVLRKR